MDEFTKACPPGWAPGLEWYPLKLYFEKLKLWWRITDLPEEQVGPVIAGRLRKGAQTLALKLRMPKAHGQPGFDIGDEALVRVRIPAGMDPITGAATAEEPGGTQTLMAQLQERYGMDTQDTTTATLETFFDLRRSNLPLQEYLNEFQLRYDDAEDKAGLQINDIGKTHLLLKYIDLPPKLLDDIKLKVSGDMSRYHEIVKLLHRLSKPADKERRCLYGSNGPVDQNSYGEDDDSGYYGDSGDYPYSGTMDSSSLVFYGDSADNSLGIYSWEWAGDHYNSNFIQCWYEYDDNSDDYLFTDGNDYYYYDYDFDSWCFYGDSDEQGQDHDGHDDQDAAAEAYEDYAFGKSKGKKSSGKGGKSHGGCTTCGSKWHSQPDCPVNKTEGKGSDTHFGKGDGFRRDFRKGKGKGKYRPYRPKGGKGKGKGHDRFRRNFPSKGKGKGKHRTQFGAATVSQPTDMRQLPRESLFGETTKTDRDLDLDREVRETTFRRPHIAIRGPHRTIHDTTSTTDAWTSNAMLMFGTAPPNASTPLVDPSAERCDHLDLVSEIDGDFRRALAAEARPKPASSSGGLSWLVRRQLYPQTADNDLKTFHTVKGKKRHGLIHDPGAASGLMGTETLREYSEAVLKPMGLDHLIRYEDSEASVTGISGKPDAAIAAARIPLPIPEIGGTFDADLIGNEGSTCPALSPLPTAIRNKFICLYGFFENGNGLMLVPNLTEERIAVEIEMLLTDSEHYLIPCDGQDVELVRTPGQPLRILDSGHSKPHASLEKLRRQLLSNGTPTPILTQPVEQKRSGKDFHKHHDRQQKRLQPLALNTATATTDTTLDTTLDDKCDDDFRCTPCGPTPDTLPKPPHSLQMCGQPCMTRGPNCSGTCRYSVLAHQDGVVIEHICGPCDWTEYGIETLPATTLNAAKQQRTQTPTHWRPGTADYPGDTFPDHFDKQKVKELTEWYRGVPEEFYTTLHLPVITPGNVLEWLPKLKAQWCKKQPLMWELQSGSARLSLTAYKAGEHVLFPIDYRYGWDTDLPEHQLLLSRIRREIPPKVLFGSPTCKWWTPCTNQVPEAQRLAARKDAHRGLQHLYELDKEQADEGLGFLNENPWPSAMFDKSPLRFCKYLPGHKGKKRADQCMHGARSDEGITQKATALDGNIGLRKTARRCPTGLHNGLPHAHLQGKVPGSNVARTCAAAVYPKGMCKALLADMRAFAASMQAPTRTTETSSAILLATAATDDKQSLPTETFYCPKCTGGKWATEEHSFDEDCRYGRGRDPGAPKRPRGRPKKNQDANEFGAHGDEPDDLTGELSDILGRNGEAGENDDDAPHPDAAPSDAPPRTTTETETDGRDEQQQQPQQEQQQQPVPQSELDQVEAQTALSEWNNRVQTWDLSAVTLDVDTECYGPLTGDDATLHTLKSICIHLVKQSLTNKEPKVTEAQVLIILRYLFADTLNLKIAYFDRRPQKRRAPPEFQIQERPFRVMLEGKDTGIWHIRDVENLQGLAPIQRTTRYEEQLEFCLTLLGSPPLEVIGRDEANIRIKRWENLPNFDFRKILEKLRNPLLTPPEAMALIRGVHEKFWHAPPKDLINLLRRGQILPRFLKLCVEVIRTCIECRKWQRGLNKPTLRAEMAGFFNDIVMTDLFFLYGRWFVLFIDECTRYKVLGGMESRSGSTHLKKMLYLWMRVFGPPRVLVSDQEGGLSSARSAAELERFSIIRRLKGSDAQGRHTGTGLAEIHVKLSKLSMRKIKAECDLLGLEIDLDDIAYESGMAQNCLLEYGGYTPAQAVLGHNPRPFLELEDRTMTAIVGARDDTPGLFETTARLRNIAGASILRSLVEIRLARANATTTQSQDLPSLKPGETEVDIKHLPDATDDQEWHGPADLLELDAPNGTVIVKWQGRPYNIPLRHIRIHQRPIEAHFVKSIYATKTEMSERDASLMYIMDVADGGLETKIHTAGFLVDTTVPGKVAYKQVPHAWKDDAAQPPILTHAQEVARQTFALKDCHGIRYGTRVRRIHGIPFATYGKLVTWLRADRSNYTTQDVQAWKAISLGKLLGSNWTTASFMMLYSFTQPWTDSDYIRPRFDDVKTKDHDSMDDGYPSLPDWGMDSIPHESSYDDGPSYFDADDDTLTSGPTTTLDISSLHLPPPDPQSPPAPPGPPAPPAPPAPPVPQTRPPPALRGRSLDRSRSSEPKRVRFDDQGKEDKTPQRQLTPTQPTRTPTRPTLPTDADNLDEGRSRSRSRRDDTQQTRQTRGRSSSPVPPPTTIPHHPLSTAGRSPSRSPPRPPTSTPPPPTPTTPTPVNPTGTAPCIAPAATPTTPTNPTEAAPAATTATDDLDATLEYSDQNTGELHSEDATNTGTPPEAETTIEYPEDTSLYTAYNARRTEKRLADPDKGERMQDTIELCLEELRQLPSCNAPRDESKKCFHLSGPWKEETEIYMSVRTGECYRVDADTDNLTEAEIAQHWRLVDEADRKELQQFVDEAIFRLRHVRSLDGGMDVMDAVWVRKWKKLADGTYIVKSRLCIRGFLDPQKSLIPTKSTTATRLSQRLFVSLCVLLGFIMESLDVSGAFLKGFSFKKLEEKLKHKGINTPTRRPLMSPPMNVWRHFRLIPGSPWKVPSGQELDWVLELLKAMYGLGDAPLSWQLCLLEFLCDDLKGKSSTFDECFITWFGPCTANHFNVQGLATAHVDDNNLGSDEAWLRRIELEFRKKFGDVKSKKLPYDHCGTRYDPLNDDGVKMSQDEFCQRLQQTSIDKRRRDDESLTPAETTTFRSLLGAMLWLCLTRLDLIADIVLAQQDISRVTIGHLRAVNNLVTKAKKYAASCGLYFRPLKPPLKLVCVADAGHATKASSYAIEGVLVLLMSDDLGYDLRKVKVTYTNEQATHIGGRAHCLGNYGRKAKRVSYSTSYGETLVAAGGQELTQMIAMRVSEVLAGRHHSLPQIVNMWESGGWLIPIDHMTDCFDFFELATGEKTMPQDKTQRLYIASIREHRIAGRIRRFIWVPTQTMLADALTKSMISKQLLCLLTSGTVHFFNTEKCIQVRMLLNTRPPTEEVVINIKELETRLLAYTYDGYGHDWTTT